MAHSIAKAQVELGHRADVLETWHGNVNYDSDYRMYYEGNPLEVLRRMTKVARMAKDYDVIHAHTGINWKRLDIVSMRLRGKPIVVHYHGPETRMGYGMSYRRIIPKAKIVSTPDLLRWHPDAEFIPNPYAPSNDPNPWPENKKIKLIHAPTNRHLKGTEKVLKAIEILRSMGVVFEFELLENVPHRDLQREIGDSHIVIDRIGDEHETEITDPFGALALEAMSRGRMTISYLPPEITDAYDSSLPVVSPRAPTAKSLAQILHRYLTDPKAVRQTGEAGIRYIKKVHDPLRIASRHVEIYKRVLN